ncbi:hypothetical protein bcere0026_53410 [Bacillus mycoides]|uniref:Transposase n=1 Tax=Bacillus mycoides TaxID=1405 RepID=C2Y2Z4_BACMY|nr:hypothetical protein bcere0026_53410 [Bacillus mycoides]
MFKEDYKTKVNAVLIFSVEMLVECVARGTQKLLPTVIT